LALLLVYGFGMVMLALRQVRIDRMSYTALGFFPGLYFLILVFFNTANIGFRHAMPVVPFLLVLLGGAFFAGLRKHLAEQPKVQLFRKAALSFGVALLLAGWMMVDVIKMHPHYIPYFSSLIGGWKNGRFIAIDSNLDWGQDLLFLKDYLEARDWPPIWLTYFGPKEYPDYYGIPHQNAKKLKKLVPGKYVFSVTALQGLCPSPLDDLILPLRNREPDVYITPSLYLYVVPGERPANR
jgi:hypothetical protein